MGNQVSTRDQILSLLKVNKQLTVSEMANHLEITEMAVRRHLNTLERDNIIATTLVRQAMGRPTNVYFLTKTGQEMFPRNYATLTVDLLRDIEDLSGKEMVQQLFERRKERLKGKYGSRITDELTLDEKITELARLQNEHGYMVELDKDAEGSYIFKEYNCPISEIAKEYPIACSCELSLFQELLGTDQVDCEICMAVDSEPHCFYKIKPKK
ncbi:ArsR family transcriptional regulator [Anaerobacillus alkalidiazotrophicus]|uniref:ArsR family transcriptional regulator n=1 Tax=Anaerobacillus alkalidiazotrophicus TaxID=472963 RepID=A0A1S2M257_9BACI|nr:metalloregulator ArsR/SmtB family transcription factor [Anaerobacillus alkalidiazotrophicus]OIJ18832.1 ArsR family transcriptional regulator [Anaerobacillus alkalidiazotrophicus]